MSPATSTEESVADLLADVISTPRFPLTREIASGLTGQAFLAVAGPPGATELEPWLLVSRLAWIFDAQGWKPAVYHNGICSWAEAKSRVGEARESGWPAMWVWNSSIGTELWGTRNDDPPEREGCFIVVVAEGVQAPWSLEELVGRSLLEVLSSAHAVTCSGLMGTESLRDPYSAQGFGAYKRLYVDLLTAGSSDHEGLAKTVEKWRNRRLMASAYLRWAGEVLTTQTLALEKAAACFEKEAGGCLEPLSQYLSDVDAGLMTSKEAGKLVLKALGWHIRGMQSMESVAFSFAGLDSADQVVLHAPDEEPIRSQELPSVLKLVENEMAPVRRIAFRKLVGAELTKEALELLELGLRDGDPLVAEAALAALEAARPASLRSILEKAWHEVPSSRIHGDGSFQRLLILALTRVREAEVPGFLASLSLGSLPCDCKPRAMPTWCAGGIVSLLGQAGWPYLRSMLESGNAYSREAAVLALGRLGVSETMGEIEEIARHDSSGTVRCAGLGALGLLGSEEATGVLIELLSSSDDDVRSAAAFALIEIGESRVSLLSKALAENRKREQFLALLEKVGSKRARNLLHVLGG